jgi:hypothetical protein
MGVIESLGLAMGMAWTSGINLYATIAALGIASRLQMIALPPSLEVLGHPLVITIAVVMYFIEFVADKIPYVDNGWDVVHTFIRVPAGAILAARALGEMHPALELAAILAGGGVALAAHGTKATARLAINTSPEPFSNWFASVGEDVTVLGGLWLSFHYPWLMLLFLALFLAFVAWIFPKVYRVAKQGFKILREKFQGRANLPEVSRPPP